MPKAYMIFPRPAKLSEIWWKLLLGFWSIVDVWYYVSFKVTVGILLNENKEKSLWDGNSVCICVSVWQGTGNWGESYTISLDCLDYIIAKYNQ